MLLYNYCFVFFVISVSLYRLVDLMFILTTAREYSHAQTLRFSQIYTYRCSIQAYEMRV